MTDLADLRSKTLLHTSSISFNLNMGTMGTVGRVEEKMDAAGGVLKEMKMTVDAIAINFISKNDHEGSILTTYPDDDKAVWREFRRELIQDGFSSFDVCKHKQLIKDYVNELGSRGLFDDEQDHSIRPAFNGIAISTSSSVSKGEHMQPSVQSHDILMGATVESRSRPISLHHEESLTTRGELDGSQEEGSASPTIKSSPGISPSEMYIKPFPIETHRSTGAKCGSKKGNASDGGHLLADADPSYSSSDRTSSQPGGSPLDTECSVRLNQLQADETLMDEKTEKNNCHPLERPPATADLINGCVDSCEGESDDAPPLPMERSVGCLRQSKWDRWPQNPRGVRLWWLGKRDSTRFGQLSYFE